MSQLTDDQLIDAAKGAMANKAQRDALEAVRAKFKEARQARKDILAEVTAAKAAAALELPVWQDARLLLVQNGLPTQKINALRRARVFNAQQLKRAATIINRMPDNVKGSERVKEDLFNELVGRAVF